MDKKLSTTLRSCLVLLIALLFAQTCLAEEPVKFVDTNLKEAIEWHLEIQNLTPTDMLKLKRLNPHVRDDIESLEGLQYAKNLTYLEPH